MILPIGTDSPQHRRPTMNYLLILINVLIFFFADRSAGYRFALDAEFPQLHQYITYAFLHASWSHLLGNMLFLFIFGGSVNCKLGNIGYLGFYLAGGVLGGAGHVFFENIPAVGASGAVCAVTGIYLILFARSNVILLFWFYFFIQTFKVPSYLLILFKFILWDNVLYYSLGVQNNIAYTAHLSGYAFGIAAGLLILALGLTTSRFSVIGRGIPCDRPRGLTG